MQVSATLLGEPDVGLLTPPEMARKTSQICMSIPQIPVIVDADTGIHKPLHCVAADQAVSLVYSWNAAFACFLAATTKLCISNIRSYAMPQAVAMCSMYSELSSNS